MALNYSTKINHLGDGDDFVAQVTGRQSIGFNMFLDKLVARGTSLTKTDYQGASTTMKAVLLDELKAGNTIILDGFLTISLSIGGTFKDADESFDPEKHEIKINAKFDKSFTREITNGLEVKRVDSNSKIPVIKSIVDLASDSKNRFLTPGRQAYIHGEKLIYDRAAADEGIFFISEDKTKELKVIYDDKPANKKMKIVIPDLSSLGKKVYLQVRSRLGTQDLRTSIPSKILEIL